MAMAREFYIPKNAKEIKDVNTDAVAYVESMTNTMVSKQQREETSMLNNTSRT